jgi:hypothetical protein
VTKKTIDSPSIRQLSRREPSWLETEVANIVVGAESNVGMAVFFVDVRGGWREVLAEACSGEEELVLAVVPFQSNKCKETSVL